MAADVGKSRVALMTGGGGGEEGRREGGREGGRGRGEGEREGERGERGRKNLCQGSKIMRSHSVCCPAPCTVGDNKRSIFVLRL